MKELKIKRYIFITAILLFAMFVCFGCKVSTPVESISIDLNNFNEAGITLLVGDEFEPTVNFMPSFASNKKYYIKSSNENVLSVVGLKVKAVLEGEAYLTVVSKDNDSAQDSVLIYVKQYVETLSTPQNLQYNSSTQSLTFNSVANAQSYTLEINGENVNIGNNTIFALNPKYFNQVLTIKVKAIAPSYSHAYSSSNSSAALQIYQASAVENITASSINGNSNLTFSHSSATKFKLSIFDGVNVEPWQEVETNSVSLMELNEKYAGKNVEIKIEALVDDEIKNLAENVNVNFYSAEASKSVYVLNKADVDIQANTLIWQNIASASGYNIFVNGSKAAETEMNSYDLLNLNLQPTENFYSVKVEPKISGNNLAKTADATTLKFNVLPDPVLNLQQETITWQEEGFCLVTLTKGSQIVFSATEKRSSYNLDFGNGNYVLSVQNLGGLNEVDGVYYLSSKISSINITKQNLQNYMLNFSANIGESYNALLNNQPIDANLFEDISNANFNEENSSLSIEGANVSINLQNAQFNPGEQTITLTNENKVIITKFVQLKRINSITINDATAIVQNDENATIKFEIYNNLSSLVCSAYGEEAEIETLDKTSSNFLPAGEYIIKVFVYGNGNTTIGVRELGREIETASLNFTVLEAPNLVLKSSEIKQIEFEKIENAREYKLYKKSGNLINEFNNEITINENCSFEFELETGKLNLLARAVGNNSSLQGDCYLSSCYGEIEIAVLNAPNLVFNKDNQKFEIIDTNDANAIENYEIKFAEQTNTFNSKGEIEYSPNFEIGINNFTITANAVDEKVDGVYYLNATNQAEINKIDAEPTINIYQIDDEFNLPVSKVEYFNYLLITPTKLQGEFELDLTFKIGEQSFNFATQKGVLTSENGYNLPYYYDQTSYYIALNNNYSPIISELLTAQTFDVSVKFKAKEQNQVTSDAFTKTLNVLKQSAIKRQQNEQAFEFVNVNARSSNSYKILIDNTYVLNIDENLKNVEEEGQNYFVLPLSFVQQKLSEIDLELGQIEHSISILTISVLNDSNEVGFAPNSNALKFAISSNINLQAKKQTSGDDVDLYLYFDKISAEFEKLYMVEFYTKLDGEKQIISTTSLTDSQAQDNIITFNLINSFDSEIYVSVYVSTAGRLQEVEMFNSQYSNEIFIKRVNAVSSFYISNNVLYIENSEYNLVANYEIYLGENKIGTVAASRKAEFNLPSQISSGNLSIRSVSWLEVGGQIYTNSNRSEPIQIIKTSLDVSLQNGDFVVNATNLKKLKTKFEDGHAYLKIEDRIGGLLVASHEIYLNDLTYSNCVKFNFETNSISIEAYGILTYSGTENLIFNLVVLYESEELYGSEGSEPFYINSNSVEISGTGLNSVQNLDIRYFQSTDGGEKIDKIYWENPNSQPSNYVLKLTYQGVTHSSLNGSFYYENELINPSNIIENNQIKLPTKFEMGGQSYVFESGEYLLEIKAVPLTENSFSSNYVAVHIEILDAVTPYVDNGNLVWQANNLAQSYSIKAYEVVGENEADWNYLTTIHTTQSQTANCTINFENEIAKDGLIALSIQAVSDVKADTDESGTKSYTINSVWSKKLVVYKLPEIEEVYINDGFLVLKANKYFSKASIEFVGGGVKYEPIYLDRQADATKIYEQLKAFNSWQQADIDANSQHYIVNLNQEGTFNVLEDETYSFNISLTGNTANADNGYLPIVNSSKTISASNLKATKIKKSNSLVGKTIGQFEINANLQAGGQTSSYSNLNYAFGEEAITDPDLLNALIYKINLSVLQDEQTLNYSIYALDYNYFSSLTSENKHEFTQDEISENNYGNLCGYYLANKNGNEIKINVYKNNIINFQAKNISYIKINAEQQEGKINYSMPSGEAEEIDLSNGGTFVLDVFVLGGDSFVNNSEGDINMGFLTSQLVENYFIRYSPNNLQTKDGEIIFKNLIKYNDDAKALDYPVYKIVAQTANVLDKKVFYLYYENEQEAREIAQANSQTDYALGSFVKILTDADNNDNIWFEISKYIQAKTYSLSVQTLAGNGSEDVTPNNLLNSIEPQTYLEVSKLKDAVLSANLSRGVRLNIAKAQTDQTGYSNSYEISLIDNDQTYVYRLNSNSENIFDQNNYLIYTMPSSILTIDGRQISLQSHKTYKIMVRALADKQNVINGSYATENGENKSLNIQIAETAEQVAISEGVLKYKIAENQNYLGVLVKMGFMVEDAMRYLIFTNTNAGSSSAVGGWYSYQFKDGNDYLFEGSTSNKSNIDAEKIYTLKLSVYGEVLNGESGIVYVLNSDFYTLENTTRQASVNLESIKAENGILTWQEVAGATGYEINVMSSSNIKVFGGTTEQLSFDLSNKIEAGNNYTISVRALADEKINAINTISNIKFTKLNNVDAESFKIETGSISWAEVENASGYNIRLSYQSNGEQKEQTLTQLQTNLSLPDDLTGNYILYIQAVGNNYDILNSNTISYSSSAERPQEISDIEWDATNARFVITPSADFRTNDTIEVRYRMNKYDYSTGAKLEENYQSSYTITNTGAEKYYFEPKIMGVYLSVYAVVNRAGSVSSPRINYLGGELDLHIFEAGDGESEPYKISNSSQLMNMGLRKNSKFVLTTSIDLQEQQEKIKENLSNFGAAICSEFNGELSGGFSNTKLSISGFNFSLTDSNFALFKTINNATIKDVILGNNSEAIIEVNCSNVKTNDLNLAVLASESVNSNIKNVTIQNIKISVSGTSQGNVFVAGLVGNSQNSNFVDCNVGFAVDYKLQNVVTKHVGGMVAKAVGGKFEQTNALNTNNVKFEFNSNVENTYAVSYLGGVVGKFECSRNQIGEISNMKIDLNFKTINAQNAGGLAGYAGYTNINNCNVVGTITTAEINQINLGGLVGKLQSSTINASGVGSTNNQFSLNASISSSNTGNIRLGLLIGELSRENERDDEINNVLNCYSYTEFSVNVTTLNPLNLGVYGYAQNGSSYIGECQKR